MDMATELIDHRLTKFATPADYAECRRLHKLHGTTYYFASRRFTPEIRECVHALYGFVRVPDEIVDEFGSRNIEERLSMFRRQLILGYDGVRPDYPVLRAFCDVALEHHIPIEEPLTFLEAMEADISKVRYRNYAELKHYMRGSAASVGVMLCHIFDIHENPEAMEAATALGEAMQLTNFLRDIGEDMARGRIYLPQDEMEMFNVTEEHILEGKVTPEFIELLKFQIERARRLYRRAELGIHTLPEFAETPVLLSLKLYERILDRIISQKYNVYGNRARTSKLEKLWVAFKVFVGGK